MNGLFREEAMQARRPQYLGTIRLATPISHQVWGVVAAAITITVLAWLCLGHYVRREHVTGTLVPQVGLLDVTARTSGTVTHVNVTAGASVLAGAALLTISDDRASATMGDTAATISAQLRDQITQMRATLVDLKPQADAQARDLRNRMTMLQAQVRQIDDQRVLQKRQADTAAHLVERVRPLRVRGIVSLVQFDQYQANALTEKAQLKSLNRQRLDTEQQLSSLQAQLEQLPLETAAEARQLKNQLAQLNAQLAQNELKRGSVLQAPRSGVVSSLLVRSGQAVSAGQPLLAILPQGSRLEAQLLVPSSAIGFVHKGTQVVLHYQAFPYQKFGVQYGTVENVSRSALSPLDVTTLLGQQAPPEPLYRVEVKLAKQVIQAYGKPQALLPGMSVDADLLLDRRRMIEWIFEPLYGMAGHGGAHA